MKAVFSSKYNELAINSKIVLSQNHQTCYLITFKEINSLKSFCTT